MKTSFTTTSWPLFAFAMCMLLLGAFSWSTPPFSIDSWSYYELSESLRSGHYALNQLRSFGHVVPGAPATSFPPLWPLLWAVASTVTGFDARSGLVLSVTCVIVFGLFSEFIGRRLTQVRWVGLVAGLMVTRLPGFWDEVTSGRTIPFQLLLSSVVLLTALRQKTFGVREAAFIGVLAGALVMTRFDTLPFALLLGFVVGLLSRSWIATALFGVALGVVVSPWVWMSHHYYGTWFASDNSGVALSIDPRSYVRDWFPPGSGPLTAREQPLVWLRKVLGNFVGLIGGICRSPGLIGVALILSLATLLLVGVRQRMTNRDVLKAELNSLLHDRTLLILSAFTLAVMSMLPLYAVSGYFDVRYFSLLNWVIYLWFGVALVTVWRSKYNNQRMQRFTGAASALMLAILFVTKSLTHASTDGAEFPAVTQAAELSGCLATDRVDTSSRVLAMDGFLAARLSAVHHVRTTFTPSNFERTRPDNETARRFFAAFNVTHVLGTPAEISSMFSPDLFADVAANCHVPLHRIVR